MATLSRRSAWSHLIALATMRCPRCEKGKPFDGLLSMRSKCPVCELHFEREPGYFMGAMYISYALSIAGIVLMALPVYLVLPNLDSGLTVLIGAGLYLPLTPIAWRYSRMIWLYFDHWAWPETERLDG
jgi:uncharacterized protein (DUF983 family)